MKSTIAIVTAGLVLCIGSNANAQTYTSSGNNVAIPDNNVTGATLDLVVPDFGVITDLNVGLVITHTWQGDLTATIEHVDTGTTALIINRPGQPLTANGYSADSFGNFATATNFVLDNGAAAVYDRPPLGGGPNNSVGTAFVTGSWKPDGPPNDAPEGVGSLAVFNGQNIHGTWRLRVTDLAGADTGGIRTLQLSFSSLLGCGAPGNGNCFQPHGGTACNNEGCCATVCAIDPFCCNVAWDGICAGEAANLCPGLCGNPNAGSCYVAHSGTACDSKSCCATVCAVDPFCCNTQWDGICAGEALQFCPCGNPNNGSCFQPHGTPYCDNESCCASVCAIDSYCCETSWDNICVAEASALCGPPPPPNDLCEFRTLIDNAPTAFSTIGATTDGPQHPGCLPYGIGGDIWFNYEATFTGTLTIRACANYPVQMAVYDGCSCPPAGPLGTLLACTLAFDDPCGGQNVGAHVSFGVAAGQCYKVRVGGELFDGNGIGEIPAVGEGELFVIKDFCPGDTDDDNDVDIDDLLAVINTWGFVNPPPGSLVSDVGPPGGDGVINIDDLLVIINGWGDCPNQCAGGFVCSVVENQCRAGTDPSCICFTSIDGNTVCGLHGACIPCSVDGVCPPGFVCVVDTCCGKPACIAVCGTGDGAGGAQQPLPPGTQTTAGIVGPDGTIPTSSINSDH